MMELMQQRFVRINIVMSLLILLFFTSCHKRVQDGRLECVLESIKIDADSMNILVSQVNGWTDSTALIIVVFEKKSMNIPNNSDLKGEYNGYDIYFNQGNVDTLDTREYKQITNNINWKKNSPKIIDETLHPPYDPISLQIEYNLERNCIGDIVKGKGYMMGSILSRCKCEH